MSDRLKDTVPRLAAWSAQILHWTPANFWTATPDELVMALTNIAAAAETPPTRAEIERMMKRDDNG